VVVVTGGEHKVAKGDTKSKSKAKKADGHKDKDRDRKDPRRDAKDERWDNLRAVCKLHDMESKRLRLTKVEKAWVISTECQ